MPNVAAKNANTLTAACPHCSLLCDDLAVRAREDGSIDVLANGCRRAASAFALSPVSAQAFIDGESAPIDIAIKAAAKRLRRMQQPLFAGLATDVDGMRGLVRLAEQRHAILDHMHGDAMHAMSHTLQSRGWYSTTLSEVRNRADLVIVIDVDFTNSYENFPRRCLAPRDRLANAKSAKRHITYIGRAAQVGDHLSDAEVLNCKPQNLHDTLLALLARLRGQTLGARRIGAISLNQIDAVVAAIRNANYCAIVFSAGELGERRSAVIATICDTVDEINRLGRGALLALGGNDGGQSALATSSWLTGYPLRMRLGKSLEYAPQRYRTQTLLAGQLVDGLLWVDAFAQHPVPTDLGAERTIVLGARRPEALSDCGIFIPVGTPGVDHFSRLIRTDSVVTLAMPATRQSSLPSVAEVAARLLED